MESFSREEERLLPTEESTSSPRYVWGGRVLGDGGEGEVVEFLHVALEADKVEVGGDEDDRLRGGDC